MSIPELKARIRSLDADALAAATVAHGDAVRGWLACVASPGPTRIERDPHVYGLAAGVALSHALADEAVGIVVLSTTLPVSDDVRALVGLLCGRDATALVPPLQSDHAWMSACARVRDAQAAIRERVADALEFADPITSGLVGLLLGLAARTTPCVLVGTAAHAAAVIGQRQSIGAAGWWNSAYCSLDPLESIACERLQYEPWWASRTAVAPEVLDALIVGTISSPHSSR